MLGLTGPGRGRRLRFGGVGSENRRPPRARSAGTLGGDQAVDPRQIVLRCFTVVLHQAAGVAVARSRLDLQPGPELHQPLHELDPAALQHAQPGIGGKVAGKRQPEVEHPIVVIGLALGRQQLFEELRPRSVMPYTFLPRLPRPARPADFEPGTRPARRR